MNECLCYNCIYFDGLKNDWIICNRIVRCYVRKDKCKYFKPNNKSNCRDCKYHSDVCGEVITGLTNTPKLIRHPSKLGHCILHRLNLINLDICDDFSKKGDD